MKYINLKFFQITKVMEQNVEVKISIAGQPSEPIPAGQPSEPSPVQERNWTNIVYFH